MGFRDKPSTLPSSTRFLGYLLIPPITVAFPSNREGGRTTGIGNPPGMGGCDGQSYAGIAGPEQGGHGEKEESRNGRGQTPCLTSVVQTPVPIMICAGGRLGSKRWYG